MWVAKVAFKDAQQVKKYLLAHSLFDRSYQPDRDSEFLYFPLNKKTKIPHATITKRTLTGSKEELKVADLLADKLTKQELSLLPTAHDQIGDIIILELVDELIPKEKLIGEAFIKANKSVNTVTRKSKIHHGVFRTRGVKIIAGKRTKDTIHRENGVRIKVNVEKMYFSNRLATERLRIANLIKPTEQILVMFSGSGVYPVVIARNAEPKSIVGVEINPTGHEYALQNLKLNHVESLVTLHNGDVNDIVPKMRKKFDRIVMPLPKTGEEFLPLALKKIKSGGTIHLYAFLNEKDINPYAKTIHKICKAANKQCRILKKIKCGKHAPYVYRVCYDIKINS